MLISPILDAFSARLAKRERDHELGIGASGAEGHQRAPVDVFHRLQSRLQGVGPCVGVSTFVFASSLDQRRTAFFH